MTNHPRAKKAARITARPVPIRIPAAMVARIDAVKDPLVPREAYVRDLLDKALQSEERKAKS